MHGAILGDVWGSVFETIPNYPRRLFMGPTDDSFLTCACNEFVNTLSEQELAHPQQHHEAIYVKAVIALKAWGQRFPEPGAFSPGFLRWAHTPGFQSKPAHTNGCLMRQAPIALLCRRKRLPLQTCQALARIFCSTTHDSPAAYEAVHEHIALIYLALGGQLERAQLAYAPQGLIASLEQWQAVAASEKNHFVWGAKHSLGIALSALECSSSWEEMMRFFIGVSGDVDTYAAIAGPLAQCFYGEPDALLRLEACLEQEQSVRMRLLRQHYEQMKADSVALRGARLVR